MGGFRWSELQASWSWLRETVECGLYSQRRCDWGGRIKTPSVGQEVPCVEARLLSMVVGWLDSQEEEGSTNKRTKKNILTRCWNPRPKKRKQNTAAGRAQAPESSSEPQQVVRPWGWVVAVCYPLAYLRTASFVAALSQSN